jgi:hypothetical protein
MEPNDFGTSGGLSQVELAAGVPTCQNGVNYYRAADTCMMVGARLCTEQELTNDETRYSGCGFDSQYVWSSTQGNCGRHRVRQAECVSMRAVGLLMLHSMGRQVLLSQEVDVAWRKVFLPAVNWAGISLKGHEIFCNVDKQMVPI